MKRNRSSPHRYRSNLLGWLAGSLQMFGKRPPQQTPAQMRRQDFTTNAQRLGLRLTDRVRNAFRHRWLKLK
ncbi:MAG: hypothetical protein L0Y36_08225 [Planctomycetales bacterium]|nr:hypothetical protein [Planctomycetales bacterium]